MAAVYGLDDEGCAGDAVAGGKHTRPRGRESVWVNGNRFLGRQANPGVVRDERQAGALADREDDRVARNNVIGIRRLLDREPASLVEGERGHRHALHAAHTPIFIAKNGFECAVVVDFNAFVERGFDLPRVGGHSHAAFQAGHRDLAAQAHGRARHVNGDVPAAENENILSAFILCFVFSKPHIP